MPAPGEAQPSTRTVSPSCGVMVTIVVSESLVKVTVRTASVADRAPAAAKSSWVSVATSACSASRVSPNSIRSTRPAGTGSRSS
jgi:hypothetical protein